MKTLIKNLLGFLLKLCLIAVVGTALLYVSGKLLDRRDSEGAGAKVAMVGRNGEKIAKAAESAMDMAIVKANCW